MDSYLSTSARILATVGVTAAAIGICGAVAHANDPTFSIAVLEGDTVSGVGTVTRIDNLIVNNQGQWIVEVDTDNPDPDADVALLVPGGLLLREGDALSAPSGAFIDSFDSLTLNANGDSAWNFFLSNTGSINNDSGLFFNSTLFIQESNVSGAPEFTAGTTYKGFFETKFNDNNNVLIMASVDDPVIASSIDRALVIASLDGNGNLLQEKAPWKEGDVLPGQSEPVEDFETGPHDFAFNNADEVMFIADLEGSTATDGAIYLGNQLLAQEGGPSPVVGRNYDLLSSAVVDVNNQGDWVFRGSLEGASDTDGIIVVNDQKLIQEGDSLPAIGSFRITGFGTGPVAINDHAQVLWFGQWDDPNTDEDSGLFLDDQLIVQEGVTAISGSVIDTIASVQDAFAMSDDGRFIIFEATLENGVDGAFLITFDLGGMTLHEPTPGTVGQNNTFAVSDAPPGARVYFTYGLRTGSTPVPGCPGLTLDIAGAEVIDFARASSSGVAAIRAFVPSNARNRQVRLQAVERSGCSVSNVVVFTFQ